MIIDSKKIRILLAERGWNQQKLATEAGVSRQYISNILRSRHKRPSYETIKKIIDALDVSAEEIVVGNDIQSIHERVRTLTPDQLEAALRDNNVSDKTATIIRLLYSKKELAQWQIEAINAILHECKGGDS